MVDLCAPLDDEVLAAVRSSLRSYGAVGVLDAAVPLGLLRVWEAHVGDVFDDATLMRTRLTSASGRVRPGWSDWVHDTAGVEVDRYVIAAFDDEQEALAAGVSRAHVARHGGPNLWPPFDPQLRPLTRRLRVAGRLLVDRLRALAADALATPIEHLRGTGPDLLELTVHEHSVRSSRTARSCHRTDGIPTTPPSARIGPNAGELLGLVRILPLDGPTSRRPGGRPADALQIRTADGDWTSVTVPEDGFLMVVGEALATLSGGRWPAGSVQVRFPDDRPQRTLSISHFLGAATEVSPIAGVAGGLVPSRPSFSVGQRLLERDLVERAASWRVAGPDGWRRRRPVVTDVVTRYV